MQQPEDVSTNPRYLVTALAGRHKSVVNRKPRKWRTAYRRVPLDELSIQSNFLLSFFLSNPFNIPILPKKNCTKLYQITAVQTKIVIKIKPILPSRKVRSGIEKRERSKNCLDARLDIVFSTLEREKEREYKNEKSSRNRGSTGTERGRRPRYGIWRRRLLNDSGAGGW